jgi:ATP/maltotriose-dependent transcriptional regulator MalT
MQAGMEMQRAQKHWKNAAAQASNLSELYLTIGDVKQALDYAKQSVELADRSGDAFLRMVSRTTLADALHQAGRLSEAEAAFREAEEIQKQDQPEFPLLYSVRGYQYCDLLLSQGQHAEVQRRARQTLEWGKVEYSLISAPLDYLSLGRAHSLQSQREPNHPFTESANFLNRAVDGLRQVGAQEFSARGLLARAEFYRITGALEKAERDLDEAFSIATRGGMWLFEADCHLEYARLCLAHVSHLPLRAVQGLRGAQSVTKQSPSRDLEIASQKTLAMTPDAARGHLAIAKKMIAEMGYHRGDKEVQELERRLEHENREITRKPRNAKE